MGQRTYLAVDLKSFYASVECLERGLDPPASPEHTVRCEDRPADTLLSDRTKGERYPCVCTQRNRSPWSAAWTP